MSLKRTVAIFFLPLVFGLLLILIVEKGETVVYLNKWHGPFPDAIIKNLTHLGDGLIFIPILIIALVYRYRFAITLAITGLLLTLVTNVLKQIVFTDFERPKRFFEGVVDLHFVEGVDIHGLNSFPSGHTATAAAIGMLLALEFRRRSIVIFSVVYPVFIGFSRVYLAQHFLQDVVFGYMEGMGMALLGYFLVSHIDRSHSWSESSLLRS